MYNVNRKDYYCLLNMLDSIEKIKQYCLLHKSADDFYNDIKSFDASMMNFIVIGEMVDKISDDLKNVTNSEIDWFKIKGFRNILAHNYFGIDAEEVWQIIQNNLPELEIQLKKIIN